ncbi:hypothetical protein CDEST_05066 [Colletotrichum destructivum]|uniref:Uncharacterized protein n=1 Tax=Colletotrichum destructivum TaxID=34406 RepID=A0AAX4I9K2_9PEZI|nr:hypothetical protein CDEST_05066 [Colletotrichum destructivum]
MVLFIDPEICCTRLKLNKGRRDKSKAFFALSQSSFSETRFFRPTHCIAQLIVFVPVLSHLASPLTRVPAYPSAYLKRWPARARTLAQPCICMGIHPTERGQCSNITYTKPFAHKFPQPKPPYRLQRLDFDIILFGLYLKYIHSNSTPHRPSSNKQILLLPSSLTHSVPSTYWNLVVAELPPWPTSIHKRRQSNVSPRKSLLRCLPLTL